MLARHHRIALLDPEGSHVLVVPSDDGPRLPAVDSRWPDHRELVAAVQAPDALAAAPPWREPDGTITNPLVGSAAQLPDAEWRPLADLTTVSAETARRLADVARELVEGAPDDGRADWWRRGWWDRVDAWVEGVLPLHGYTRAGPREPVKVWSLSAVGRYPVTGGQGAVDLWFKATCEGFRSEAALTQLAAELWPGLLPRVLGVEADQAWMLMEPIDGAGDGLPAERAPDVAAVLAGMQLDSIQEREAFLRAGAPDRGLEATLEGMRLVLRESVERPFMSEDLLALLPELEGWLEEQVRSFWSHDVPDTFSHGDLHLGNAAWVGDHPVVFDWTDLCWSHPLLDLQHLAQDAGDAGRDAIWTAYAEVWRAHRPDLELGAAWAEVEVTERVFQMITFEGIYRAQPEESRWELSLVVVELLEKLVEIFRSR